MNPETQRMARLWLAVVFLLGAAVGVVFGYAYARRTSADTKPGPAAMTEPERRAKRVNEMTKEIGLTPEQSAKVDEIIRGAHEEMKAIREKADGDADAVREKARDQIREFLTPGQKTKFEAMIQRMDEERKKAAGK